MGVIGESVDFWASEVNYSLTLFSYG